MSKIFLASLSFSKNTKACGFYASLIISAPVTLPSIFKSAFYSNAYFNDSSVWTKSYNGKWTPAVLIKALTVASLFSYWI